MSKIIKQSEFEKVNCAFCGCEYEYEKGDTIETLSIERMADATPMVVCAVIECPICGVKNPIKVKK